MARPIVRIYERKRVNIPGGSSSEVYAEIGYETEIRVGESESAAVQRAMNELTAELQKGGAIRADSFEERIRKATKN